MILYACEKYSVTAKYSELRLRPRRRGALFLCLAGRSGRAGRVACRRQACPQSHGQAGRHRKPGAGIYVIVPPEYHSLGCLPADQFIPALMKSLGQTYYAGLLSAAQYHGAAHHRPQEFQVFLAKNRRPIQCGKVSVAFMARKRITDVPVQSFNTPRGTILVSTPEATAIDLVGYQHHAGGLDQVATILSSLSRKSIRENSRPPHATAPLPWAQRLGYLLEHVDAGEKASALKAYVHRARKAGGGAFADCAARGLPGVTTTGISSSMRTWRRKHDSARLHHGMARTCAMGAGYSGRTGPRHLPGALAIFSASLLKDALAFRGGTALYKLHLKPAARYSEDIDLVQVKAGAAGPMMQALRAVLDPWLGVPRWKQTEGRVTFVYRFDSEDTPPIGLRLKVEINSREHFAVHGFTSVPFGVSSRWFEGSCQITSYELDELLATKLRALYQRKKGRDLFDLATALKNPAVDPDRIIAAFSEYMDQGGHHITRELFERNLASKLRRSPVYRRHRPVACSRI